MRKGSADTRFDLQTGLQQGNAFHPRVGKDQAAGHIEADKKERRGSASSREKKKRGNRRMFGVSRAGDGYAADMAQPKGRDLATPDNISEHTTADRRLGTTSCGAENEKEMSKRRGKALCSGRKKIGAEHQRGEEPDSLSKERGKKWRRDGRVVR